MTDAVEAPDPQFERVMLKISGEALMGPQGFGLHLDNGWVKFWIDIHRHFW